MYFILFKVTIILPLFTGQSITPPPSFELQLNVHQFIYSPMIALHIPGRITSINTYIPLIADAAETQLPEL